jgi:hypothetical protein
MSEPTMEQMERTMLALGLPILPPGLQPPHYRESLLNLHALVQRMADGDESAANTVASLQAAFGTRERTP